MNRPGILAAAWSVEVRSSPLGTVWDITPKGYGPVAVVTETRELADVIVRAVNSHADLLAALDALLPFAEAGVDAAAERSDDDSPSEVLEQARAALAEARGG